MKLRTRAMKTSLRMPPKSEFWKHFEKIDNSKAKCRICAKTLKTSGNTSNLKAHINKMHALVTQQSHDTSSKNAFRTPSAISPQASGSVRSETIETDSECESEKSFSSTGHKCKQIRHNQPTLSSTFHTISAYAETGFKGVKITNAILYMICKDCQPFQIVENEGFLNLMKISAPLYKVPSRFTLKRMLENKFVTIQNLFKKKIGSLDSVTLTTDIWTDTMQARSFLGVTMIFFDVDKVDSITLGVYDLTHSHTAEYVASVLIQCCEEWSIETKKVQAVVTDAGPNIVKAVEIAFGKKYHIPCFAHMLNLVTQKSIEKTNNLPELIASVKKIVTWFKQSVVASDELRKESDLKLIQDVPTRWNSTFFMIERFLKLRPAINTIINCHASAPPMLTARDIIDLNEICEFLRPIEVATREICGEKYVTCSKVIPLTRLLNTKISSLTPKQNIAEKLQINILAEINKRLLPTEYVNTLAIASLLDPRFKNIHFQNAIACSKAIQRVKELVSTAVVIQAEDEQPHDDHDENETQKNDSNDLWNDHYRLVSEKNSLSIRGSESESTNMPSELSSFLKSPIVDLKEDPLELWHRVLGCAYPMLKKIAIKHLTCVATSTSSERLFSKAGQTLYQQRNRLKGKLLSKLLILQSIDKKLWDF